VTIILDQLNERIARRQASDRELMRLTRQTIEEFDADTTAPDPPAYTPFTRCRFNCYVKLRNVNGARDRFHQYLVEHDRALKVLTVAQWDSLLAIFDARDERQTQLDARNAGTW